MASKSSVQVAKVAPPAVAPKAPKTNVPAKVIKAGDSKTTDGKAADSKAADNKSGKMHKRSRSGCYVCRLRRKKCNEEKPYCRACRYLGLTCEYKRPIWWGNAEQRKAQKEHIKEVIKQTKTNEKTAQQGAGGGDSTPSLTHSLPTSATPDNKFIRAGSPDSAGSFDFNQPLHENTDFYNPQVYTPQFDSQFERQHPYSNYSTPGPYEVNVKTERQMFVNDEQTRTDTTISTFNTFHTPFDGSNNPLHNIPEENWLHEEIYQDPVDIFTNSEEDSEFGIFDFPRASAPPSHQACISVDEADRPLLDYFIDNVLPLTFPILDANQPGLARSEVILPALESNKTYLHCCLSAAAVHKKFTQGLSAPPTLENDIIRHRFATINELCESFKRNIDHTRILDATLALILFQSATGHPDDTSPDIPWHQHFAGASDLVRRLGYDQAVSQPMETQEDLSAALHPPFSMSLSAWIDILGATMLGRAPIFADAFRDAHLASRPLGLGALMGCDDSMMVMVSEIACLEALKLDKTLNDVELCAHITMLAQQLDLSEVPNSSLVYPYTETGALRPRQLGRNITAIFRKAARIWLLSLIPGASRTAETMQNSLSQFSDLLDFVPGGAHGFDRSLVWPVFIAGIQTSRGGALRSKIETRWNAMGEQRDLGNFGRMVRLLREVWRRNDEIDMRNSSTVAAAAAAGVADADYKQQAQQLLPDIHWRDVMRECRLDFLPI